MRTVTVKLDVHLTLKVDEDVEIQQIINQLEYNFRNDTTQATVEDSEIVDFEVTSSR